MLATIIHYPPCHIPELCCAENRSYYLPGTNKINYLIADVYNNLGASGM